MKSNKIINIFLILLLLIFQNVISFGETREVPNIIIKDNPKKEVYQIDTIKRRTKPAELNLTVTKIKTEEIIAKIDRERNTIFTELKGIEDKDIYALEDLKNLPNPDTANGRRAINNLKTEDYFSVKKYDLKFKENKTKIEIKYKQLPKNMFLVVTDKGSFNNKKIYKVKLTDYIYPKGNNITIKLWIFGEEMGSLTNLVINPSNNGTGNVEIRKEGEYSYPEDAVVKEGLHTVFDMSGQPQVFEFEDDDKIELERLSGTITVTKDNQGSFYKERNKYAECTIPGYNLKTRIWSDSNKIEFSLNKTNKNDGYVKFKIKHKTSDGTIRQQINVELFINNKAFDNYFRGLVSYSRVYNFRELYENYDDSSGKFVYEIYTDGGAGVINLISDRVDYTIITPTRFSPIEVKQTWGERNGERKLGSYSKIESPDNYGFGDSTSKKVNAYVGGSLIKVYTDWIDPWYNTTQYFEFKGSYLSYCKEKRKIWLKNTVGVTDGYFESFGVNTIGTVVGLPIKNGNLTLTSKNGNGIIVKFEKGDHFYITKKINGSQFKLILDGQENTLSSQGAQFYTKYITYSGDFKYYNICFQTLELKAKDRVFQLKGIDGIFYALNKISIPKFSPETLINRVTSSLEKSIIRYIDVSDKFQTNFINVNLGEIYFNRYDDIGVLRENSTTSPYVSLPNHVYLEDTNNKKRIDVELSFDKDRDVRTLNMANYKTSSKEGGGNGSKVYLKLSPDAYKKIIGYGGDKTYILKGGNINVGINIDKAPLTGRPAGKIEKELVSNITIRTQKVDPAVSTISFNENKPLLKDKFFEMLNNSIMYLSPYGSYNDTISLHGRVAQYNFTTRKHNYELVQNNGKYIKGFISSNGNGGYWENIDIGDGNTITLSQGKNTKTYMALTKWNYERSSGTISIKHYIESSPETNQYYKFYFKIPKFNPTIYYNENYNMSNSIKLNKEIVKNIDPTSNTIELGYVAIQDWDTAITIQNSGNKKDTEGLRIEKQIKKLDILTSANVPTGQQATLKLVDDGNQNIIDNKIVGGNKHAKVILELPSGLNKIHDYIIKSDISEGEIFNDSKNGYILKIGRNGYWKEIIKSIKLIGNGKVEGKATLKFSNLYEENSKITFKTVDYGSLDSPKLEAPIPTGVSLEDTSGFGMLKGKSNDIASVEYKGEIISLGNLNTSATTGEKEINLESGNKIQVRFNEGKFVISLVEKKLGTQLNEDIKIILNRNGGEVLNFALTLSIEESWLKIIDREVLDFGKVLAEEKNLEAKASILLETSNSINENNIKVLLPERKILMHLVSNPSINDLEAEIIYYDLKKQSVENKYKIDVEGKLHIKNTTTFGEHRGIAEFIIEIKE